MSVGPFKSDAQLVKFASGFFRDRVGSFRKDIKICMTPDANGHHAYFPALITCIGFVDLLSGLHAGTIRHHSLAELQQYVARFMNTRNYTPLSLTILYECFRHKLAHLSFPYLVFDTSTKAKAFVGHPRRRVTWTVYASKRRPPIDMIDYSTPQFIKRSLKPWPISYDCRVRISVPSFKIDIIRSIYGPSGYLHHLKVDRPARERFAKCMVDFYPP
jgi:hypothetical protein